MRCTPSVGYVGRCLCARVMSGAAGSSSLRTSPDSPGAKAWRPERRRPLRPATGRSRARAWCGATRPEDTGEGDPVLEGVEGDDDMGVLATHTQAVDDRPTPVAKAVLAAFPDRITSVSGARKLVRRGQVALDGRVVDATRKVMPGETVQLLTRLSGLPLPASAASNPNINSLQVPSIPPQTPTRLPACCWCASGRASWKA